MRDVEVAAAGLLKVENVIEPEDLAGFLKLDISLSCAELSRAGGGLPLEEVERFTILVPSNFPFAEPHALVPHDRFAGFPHVQWKHSLCLYQAPSTEWNPSDGVFGFLDRLYYWLKQGALGQLDSAGAPLHPPVAYPSNGPTRIVVPRVDTPPIDEQPWFGTAHLKIVSDLRVDIIGWTPFLDAKTPRDVAAAVLLPIPFPFEFPATVSDLIKALDERTVSRDRLLLTLQWALFHNPDDTPLYVIIGTPMRGIAGGELRQHLTAWYIEPDFAWSFKEALGRADDSEELRELRGRIEQNVLRWSEIAEVAWCSVREDRPEIVIRRDQGAPLGWFAGRIVAVWGCGALGGHIAEYLARAGVAKLILRDNRTVTPGVLVRQPFDDADIGSAKATALLERIRRIRPDLEVEVSLENLLQVPLGEDDWVAGADIVIDATASTPVAELLERRRWNSDLCPPVISMAIGHDARRGMATLSFPDHVGGPLDVGRRLKLEACDRGDLAPYLEEFWPADRRAFFQPEPGCSDATFIGSIADVAGLAASLLNLVAMDLLAPGEGMTATGHFLTQPHACGPDHPPLASFGWPSDLPCLDVHAGYQVRISQEAWGEIQTWIVRGSLDFGPASETGGLLFGERDDAAGVIWVTEVSGPPRDSSASPEAFICGVDGTAELNVEKRGRSRGSVHYVGMWHTHPDTYPLPSETDWHGMRRLVAEAGGASRSLLLIVGYDLGTPMLGTYVFRAADFASSFGGAVIRPCVIRAIRWAT